VRARAEGGQPLRIWRAASCAALPFRSLPVDAAVAEVLATLLGVGGGDAHARE
jgi:hypothetical protein